MSQDKKMLNQLLLAKKMSDQENYVAKYNLMNKLLKDHPDEFYVDQDHPEYPGIVHAPTGFRMHLPRQATYGIEKKTKEEDMEKASALGYKALTGNLGPLKQIIKHLRNQGYSGLGGRVHDPNLGRFKHTPISRVIPSNPKAQLPNTQHLPIGESKAFFNSGNARSLVVGKGMPRMNLDIKDKNLVGYIPGMPGGTNPSPISSFLHEAGHLEHARMVKQLAQSNSKVFGSNLPYSLKDYGIHGISSGKYNPLTLLDEVGANNSALQLLKQTGATPQAQAFYKGVRYPSFKTHLDAAISDQTPNASSLINKITKEAPHGFTQDYSGINRFYDV